jgi:ABC-2 type transport system permease protein
LCGLASGRRQAHQEAMSTLPAPRTYGAINLIGVWTLYVREVLRFMKVLMQTVVGPVVSTWLYMVVFVVAFGADKRMVEGVSLPDFLAPGLIMLAVLSNAFANSSSSLIVAKMQGNASDFLMPPLSAGELTAAFVAGAVTRGVAVAVACAASVAFYADVWPKDWLAAIYFTLAASVVFSTLGVIGGVWADKFDHLAAVTTFVITPLTFLSGTFYSTRVLPEPFYTITHWNPVFYMIDGVRYGFTGHADGDLAIGAVYVGVLALAGLVACWALFRSGWKMKA